MSTRVLLCAVTVNLYFGSHCHSLHFGYTFRGALCIKYVNRGYQNDNQSVSLIPKWDPGITNFSISDTRIENSISGSQSLLDSSWTRCICVCNTLTHAVYSSRTQFVIFRDQTQTKRTSLTTDYNAILCALYIANTRKNL